MIESTFKLAQKAALRIRPAHNHHPSFQLLTFLQSIIYENIQKEYDLELNWERFCTYGQEESADQTRRIQTITLYDEAENRPTQWALKLSFRDRSVRRRKWQLHISVDMKDADTAVLYYALMYCDHMAGSFSVLKPPVIIPPSLLPSLNQNPRLLCCCGSYQLPYGAIAIDEQNIQTIAALLHDPEREIPVVLITCPDLVSPSRAEKMLFANAVVCWLDDMDMLEAVNSALSPQIYVEWDSIQVILPQIPEQSQHLRLRISDISRLGEDSVIALLRQAYCESLRGDDRRAFITVDDIFRQRDKQSSLCLQRRLTDIMEECNRLRTEIAAVKAENSSLRQQNDALSTDKCKQEISSYEALLSESMEQYDLLRNSILDLTQRLYGSLGQEFIPESKGEACLCDLEHAIMVRVTTGKNRSNG